MNGFNPKDPFNDEEFIFETIGTENIDILNNKIQIAYKKQMQTLEKLILPFLKNLMKNPETDTIKWPNREAAIKSQIEKITAITKNELKF
jgi:hypothetical protein